AFSRLALTLMGLLSLVVGLSSSLPEEDQDLPTPLMYRTSGRPGGGGGGGGGDLSKDLKDAFNKMAGK
ncbi:hypothetical protein Pmani_020985, partial [Petrolisthes manimaculis]